jgi:hypothetical protein
MPTPDAIDADLEDDNADPLENPTRDLSRPVRKLAAAVLVRAVLDSKMRANPLLQGGCDPVRANPLLQGGCDPVLVSKLRVRQGPSALDGSARRVVSGLVGGMPGPDCKLTAADASVLLEV